MARMDMHSDDPGWESRFQLDDDPKLFETVSPLEKFERQHDTLMARARPIRKKVTRKIRNSLTAPYRLWIR